MCDGSKYWHKRAYDWSKGEAIAALSWCSDVTDNPWNGVEKFSASLRTARKILHDFFWKKYLLIVT